MSGKLKVGDRVRLITRSHEPVFHYGDKGTILLELDSTFSGKCFYLVLMDKDNPATSGVVFTEDEIEPDV